VYTGVGALIGVGVLAIGGLFLAALTRRRRASRAA
jgi:hypothetical protein